MGNTVDGEGPTLATQSSERLRSFYQVDLHEDSDSDLSDSFKPTPKDPILVQRYIAPCLALQQALKQCSLQHVPFIDFLNQMYV